MRTYERPTLSKAGGFRRTTGIGNKGPRDLLGGKQLL
ncbi:keywimysin-related RiPP [Streptomyces sp. TRM 70361]|nr:keywimysin-related RiPP [Streptomyces sp. TRM 70361]MEE1943203.1 keywimysin-related RiPP [Streptomyces sp. TRM 70361]